MRLFIDCLVAAIALEHLWFLVVEMFLWERPTGLKLFQMSEGVARSTSLLACSHGLYNGFLCAGLLWSLMLPPMMALPVKTFFLTCVSVAGIFGGITVLRHMFVV